MSSLVTSPRPAPQSKASRRPWPKLVLALATLTAVVMGPPDAARAEAQIGQLAPEISVPDTHGAVHPLSGLRGKVVVLEWVNFECPYTRKHYDSGNMQSLQREAAEQGAVWLSVISSAPGKQGHLTPDAANAALVEEGALPTALLLDEDGRLGRAYGAKTTPHMYVIDPSGRLAYMGGIDSIASARSDDIPKAEPLLADAMRAVVRGETPAKPVSRPYGCSVKY